MRPAKLIKIKRMEDIILKERKCLTSVRRMWKVTMISTQIPAWMSFINNMKT